MNRKSVGFLLLLSCPLGWLSAQSASQNGTPSTCQFHRADDHFDGSCGPLFDQVPEMTLHSVASISSGAWRNDIHPVSVWSGEMTDQGHHNAVLELEIYADKTGILRTAYGWLPVRGFELDSTMSFDLDPSREVKPSNLDLEIVRRAATILATESAWNRNDNRMCPVNAATWSIYCALEKAESELAGGVHHRRPVAEIVRKIVEKRTETRHYHHALMDYNNDPTTQFKDIQMVFKDAESQITHPQPYPIH